MTRKLKAADLFCGAGGTTAGLIGACQELGIQVDLTAINHWPRAVETHSANHPLARHLCASLDALNPRDLFSEGELDLLWASPECTHHSSARGGRPIKDQSRASAWCIVRWADALRPSVILVENVREFLTWGPINAKGRRIRRKSGDIFRSWVKCLEAIGYRVDWRILCAADYGDPTTRRRLFICARLDGRSTDWPVPTHSADQWIPARDIIDFSLPSRSIFDRSPALKPKTIRRIMIGLERFGIKPFVIQPAHSNRTEADNNCRVSSITDPLGAIPCSNRFAIVEPFLVKLRGTATAASIDAPAPAVTAGGNHLCLVEPYLVKTNHASGDRVSSIDSPLPTVCGNRGEWAICEPYLVKFYGTGAAKSVNEPIDTVTVKPRFGLCQPSIEINGDHYKIDLRFRMLQDRELARAQGFPDDYKFVGNKTEIVKQIGNAVPVHLAKAIVKSLLCTL